MTNPSPNTVDLSGLPGPVVEQVKQIVAEARQKQSDAQCGKGQASVIGLYADLGIRTPSLEEFEEARRELGANFPRDFPDPVERLLVSGAAKTVAEAEEMVLNNSYEEVIKLLQSPLSDEELGRHPLLVLYRTRGSRPREDDLL